MIMSVFVYFALLLWPTQCIHIEASGTFLRGLCQTFGVHLENNGLKVTQVYK